MYKELIVESYSDQFESDEAARKRGNHFAQERIVKILPDGRAFFI